MLWFGDDRLTIIKGLAVGIGGRECADRAIVVQSRRSSRREKQELGEVAGIDKQK